MRGACKWLLPLIAKVSLLVGFISPPMVLELPPGSHTPCFPHGGVRPSAAVLGVEKFGRTKEFAGLGFVSLFIYSYHFVSSGYRGHSKVFL